MVTLSRRHVLAGGGFALLLGLAGCTGDDDSPDLSAASATPPSRDERQRARLAAAEAVLVDSYAAAVAAFPELAGPLAPYADHHRSHLDALGGRPEPTPEPTPTRPASATTSAPAQPPPPPDRATVVAELLAAEAAQAERATRTCRSADDPLFARLTASIASSEAVHADLLGGV